MRFQCHHGVPAFFPPDAPSRVRAGFNATTAFLLPFLLRHPWGPGAVSMPPRRSCFFIRHHPPESIARFQCHHGVPAFLVPMEETAGSGGFQCHHGVPAFGGGIALLPPSVCFNATTAFLLFHPRSIARRGNLSFNATTAFLLS